MTHYEYVSGEACCGLEFVPAAELSPGLDEVTCPLCLEQLGVLRRRMVRSVRYSQDGEVFVTSYEGFAKNREQG
jgi:hypothetical protein